MTKSNDTSETVIIKKYANRRLYDTSTSSYVTLEHLSDLVRREVDFEVRDAKTGEDLTRQVLTQIIFEKENKGEGALPVNFLRKLIGFYGAAPQTLLPAWLEMSMNSFADSQEKWNKTLGKTPNPFAMFEQQTRANMELFENAMRMFRPSDSAPTGAAPAGNSEAAKPKAGFNEDAVAILRGQMEAMQAQLDALSGKN
ncbi:MAG: polyhydroxyalkanoate synthesis repressor PhaR [Alphaproteobacteria bacterium]|nr:polyhydroxyalkanoate synthesis repressor PhaR [Alphaproteobacteria bacterium]